jgi:RNA polymerase sigma-70 factor (ECF subfamily)
VDRVEEFVEHRDYLVGIAYRMLGSFDEAEDVVQDAMMRAERAETRDIEEPRAWLTRIVTNLALDRLKSARVRRESYVGPWLPEPSIGSPWNEREAMDPADRVTLDEQISLALLTVLETLSPAERAVYVLHEAFAVPLSEVAVIVGRSPDAVRQLAVRARRHVEDRAPRFDPDPSEQARVVAAFADATENGDLEALAQLLDDEVVFRSDGGGVVRAAPQPVEGRARVLQTIRASLRNTPNLELEQRVVNGEAGLIGRFDGGAAVFAFVVRDGRIAQIDVVANPQKLRRLPDGRQP